MLIAFTSNPLLLSPPTTDHRLIEVALQSLNPKFILTKGTSLKKLFKKLTQMHTGHKNLILMTDGGEEDNVNMLTNLLHDSDISLITLALGSKKGTTIEVKENHLLKDKEGNLVITRINPLLKDLTSAVNGTYLTTSSTPRDTAISINHALDTPIDNTQHIEKIQYHYLELYTYPLGLALLLFLLLHTRAIKYLLILFALVGFQAEASLLDDYHLHTAYVSYAEKDFNTSKIHLEQITAHSLQSKLTLANSYYKMQNYQKAIGIYTSIRSSSALIKQQLYYNIATAYAQLGTYSKAKVYYTKALQLGDDEDTKINLKYIMLLEDKNNASLGIAHPKSQSDTSSKSIAEEKKDKKSNEDQPSSGSGASGENSEKKQEEKDKQLHKKLIEDDTPQEHPLGSKVYELINKGYIHETQPW
jgi:Ca-activated chloride channel family protein